MQCILPFSIAAVVIILFSSCQEPFDQRLQREARDFTERHCPQELERGTQLDSTTYDIVSRTYILWYSVALEKAAALEENAPLLHELLLKELRSDVNHQSLKDKKVNFRYIYRLMGSGRTIYETTINPREYRQR